MITRKRKFFKTPISKKISNDFCFHSKQYFIHFTIIIISMLFTLLGVFRRQHFTSGKLVSPRQNNLISVHF